MNDLLELIENGWKIEIEKKNAFTIRVTASKDVIGRTARRLEYNMNPSHPEKKLILLDVLNSLKIASKG